MLEPLKVPWVGRVKKLPFRAKSYYQSSTVTVHTFLGRVQPRALQSEAMLMVVLPLLGLATERIDWHRLYPNGVPEEGQQQQSLQPHRSQQAQQAPQLLRQQDAQQLPPQPQQHLQHLDLYSAHDDGATVTALRRPNGPSSCANLRRADLSAEQAATVDARMRAIDTALATVAQYMMFLGYGRSGHSLLGALIDGHPNVALANEANALPMMDMMGRRTLFRELARNTATCAVYGRMQTGTNYSFGGALPWQGRWCTEERGPTCTATPIYVIGDKKGGASTMALTHATAATELARLVRMSDEYLRLPVTVVHMLRNPFDLAATQALVHADPTNCNQDFVDCYRTNKAGLLASGKRLRCMRARDSGVQSAGRAWLCASGRADTAPYYVNLTQWVDKVAQQLLTNGAVRDQLARSKSGCVVSVGPSGSLSGAVGDWASGCAHAGMVTWIDLRYEDFAASPAAHMQALLQLAALPPADGFAEVAAAQVRVETGLPSRELFEWPPEAVAQLKEAMTKTGLSGDATDAGRLEPMLRDYLASVGRLVVGEE